jgi:hypothetical protein
VTSPHYVEEPSLSVAWARGLQIATAARRAEVVPLVVSITGFNAVGEFEEVAQIRQQLDCYLEESRLQSVETVANTIFPVSLWNPSKPREELFDRYAHLSSRLQKLGNPRGTYFQRMISGGPELRSNQLDFLISTHKSRKGVRRSALQVSVFDPKRDHSLSARLGFPCLQHVTFAPTDEGLSLNAFYAVQYLVERAYGNYVGLCHLGRFVAHELDMPLVRVTCLAGIAQCERSKAQVKPMLASIEDLIGRAE